ncbi:ATP-binding protein [Rubrivirga sp.]|uniref:sensor histidine kinase n=1 Tax=Rubrivirga sp. TaxID=1885344 RepID=UPI003C719641
MPSSDDAEPRPGSPGGRTVFWKVAGVLVGAQVATALLAVVLSSFFAQERSQDLLAGTLQLRLDAVAEEVELRADIGPLGEIEVDARLQADLATRFPDPVALLDETGAVAGTFGGPAPPIPDEAIVALEDGRIAVDLEDGWGLAPILAFDGLPVGALFVSPLTETVKQEQRGTRAAFWRAVWVTVLVAVVLALILGALFARRLLRPVLEVTRRVERLGEGDYADRLPEGPDDELGRLARSVNEMAARVEASITALRDTDRLRRELVANVGHDLRTPLAALRLTLDEAERFSSEGRGADIEDALAAARRQAEGAGDLVADLFELSVLDAPGRDLRLDPVPIGELVNDVAGRHRRAFAAANIAFEVDVPAGLPVLEADGARLVRALSNLLDNARRHTDAGGTVRLSASRSESQVVLDVADTGEGIAQDVLPHVFERYYRGGGARTRGKGTGLGLAIARAVAVAHGGALEVESEVGAGSTFRMTLPV